MLPSVCGHGQFRRCQGTKRSWDLVVIGDWRRALNSLKRARRWKELQHAGKPNIRRATIGLAWRYRPIRDAFVSDIRPAILVLFGAVMFVLLMLRELWQTLSRRDEPAGNRRCASAGKHEPHESTRIAGLISLTNASRIGW